MGRLGERARQCNGRTVHGRGRRWSTRCNDTTCTVGYARPYRIRPAACRASAAQLERSHNTSATYPPQRQPDMKVGCKAPAGALAPESGAPAGAPVPAAAPLRTNANVPYAAKQS